MVGVAQLVERCVVVADVAGSSPVTHPIDGACHPKAGGPDPSSSTLNKRVAVSESTVTSFHAWLATPCTLALVIAAPTTSLEAYAR